MHSSTIRTGFLFSLFAFGLGHLHAQTIRIPVAKRKAESKTQIQLAAHAPAPPPPAPSVVTLTTPSESTLSFGEQKVKTQSQARTATLTNVGANPLSGISAEITGLGARDFTIGKGVNACEAILDTGKSCEIYVIYSPSSAKSSVASLSIAYAGSGSPQSIVISGSGVPDHQHCWVIPIRESCMDQTKSRNDNINNFFGVADQLSYFGQIKSIYNGASSSATVSADFATLWFPAGFAVNGGTNIQAGSTPPTEVAFGTTPTLAATSSAQATQNLLYGGTIYADISYPLIANGASGMKQAGNFGTRVDIVGREGVDIQNFKAGTSTTATAPPSHASVQLQGYAQYNSTNLTTDSSTYAGAIFLGFAYGYNYMSHSYQRDYGFLSVNNGVGQVPAGILVSGVAKIAVSRGFGPSQTFIDSTTGKTTTVNNFKSYSFGITYQSPGAK